MAGWPRLRVLCFQALATDGLWVCMQTECAIGVVVLCWCRQSVPRAWLCCVGADKWGCFAVWLYGASVLLFPCTSFLPFAASKQTRRLVQSGFYRQCPTSSVHTSMPVRLLGSSMLCAEPHTQRQCTGHHLCQAGCHQGPG